MSTRVRWTTRVAATIVVVALAAGCSSSGGASATKATDTTHSPKSVHTTVDISQLRLSPIPAGKGVAEASATVARSGLGGSAPALSATYSEREYLMSGVAGTYSGTVTDPKPVSAAGTPYTTRILVRLPTDPAKFSGRVFIEPFNTSGGAEEDVVWAQVGPMLEASGDAWVGVTVRASAVTQLQSFDPVRYGGLTIPVNDVEWDMLRQLGGLLKQGGSGSVLPRPATYAYLGGYSQSSVDVATFASGFSHTTRMSDGSPVYAGYLPAAHAASYTDLQSGTSALPKFEFRPMPTVGVPVIDLETQSDVEGFKADISPGLTYTNPASSTVRRADSDTTTDKYRLYELAGAPHAPYIPGCDGTGSTFPTAYFLSGAITLLYRWAEHGEAPPTAPRIKLATTGQVATSAVDSAGNAVGGLRSPELDVPLASYEAHSTPGAICELSGRETPLPTAQLTERYGSVDAYMTTFTKSLDATIAKGFLRSADRQALLDMARKQAQAAFAG